jgi:hypothetical protein
MRLIVVSVVVGILVTILVGLGFGWPGIKVAYGIIPGLIAAFAAAFFIYRRVSARVAEDMARVQQLLTPTDLSRPTQPPIGGAIEVLLGTKQRLGPWLPSLGGQVEGHIGSLLYMAQRFEEARPHLLKAGFQHGPAHAMMGAIHFRAKEWGPMKLAFERSVKFTSKEAVLWNAYAWCLAESGDRDTAIAVLNRALVKMPGEARTRENLEALQNNRRMKMRAFEMPWYQFLLEQPPQDFLASMGYQVPQQRGNLPRPGFRTPPKSAGGPSAPKGPAIRRRDTKG